MRIDRHESVDGVTVEVHGWLSGVAVPEFEAVCDSVSGSLRIELSQLAGADAEGVRALRSRIAAGARAEGASPYIALLMESGELSAGRAKLGDKQGGVR